MECKKESEYEKLHRNLSRTVEVRGRYKSFRCPNSLFRELETAANQFSMNTSELIREAIIAHLRALEEKGFYFPKKRGKGVVGSLEN